jgi:hypothetical protein
MLDIHEPVLSQECSIVAAIKGASSGVSSSVEFEIIDTVTDRERVEGEVYDLNRCSYGG